MEVEVWIILETLCIVVVAILTLEYKGDSIWGFFGISLNRNEFSIRLGLQLNWESYQLSGATWQDFSEIETLCIVVVAILTLTLTPSSIPSYQVIYALTLSLVIGRWDNGQHFTSFDQSDTEKREQRPDAYPGI